MGKDFPASQSNYKEIIPFPGLLEGLREEMYTGAFSFTSPDIR